MDEERKPLPELIPTQFVFSAATMVHIGPFSEGNMLIERFCTAHTVETQHFHRLPSGIGLDNVRWVEGSDDWARRVDQLVELLRNVPCERTLIFVNSLHNCHVLLKFFRDGGWPVVSFMKGPSGRMGPRFRDAQKFVDGESNIMIATEFGGRGIDWYEVDHVINFQMPTGAVGWLHRVGRTGRMGKRGLVTNFVGVKDQALADLITMRLQAGKDLHGIFSRKRSLRRRIREQHLQDDPNGGGHSSTPRSEDGSYRLDGGMELFAHSSASSSLGSGPEGKKSSQPQEGVLLGYMSSTDLFDDAVPKHRSAKTARTAPETPHHDKGSEDSRPSKLRGAAKDNSLLELRQRLLASDSESDAEAELTGDDSDSDAPEDERQGSKAGSDVSSTFSWSKLADSREGSVLAPAPTRQLDRTSSRKQEDPRKAKRYLDQDRLPGTSRSTGGRKALGVRSRNQVAAGRNYSSPDDELLL